MKPDTRASAWLALLVLVLVLAGHLIVLQRSSQGRSPWYAMSYDAEQYVAMIEGKPVSPPYSHRFLVPWLASLLPMRADQALRAITYGSLLAAYWGIGWTAYRLGAPPGVIVASLVALFATLGNLLFYANPFLTDGFATMCLVWALYSTIFTNGPVLALSSTLGILARESALAFLPVALLTRKLRIALTVGALGLLSFWLPRLIIGGRVFVPDVDSLSMLPYLAKAYLTWGVLWVVAVAGVLLSTPRVFPILGATFACTICAAALAGLGSDVTRMFLITMPVVAVATTRFFDELWRRSPTMGWVTAVLCATSGLFALPTRIWGARFADMTELEEFYSRLAVPILIQHALSWGAVSASLWVMRNALWEAVSGHIDGVRTRGRSSSR